MKEQKKIFQAFSFILQFTLNMLVPIGMCMALGIWLDDKYDMPWIIIVLFFVGACAGFTSIYKMSKPLMESDRNKKRNNDIK